MNKIDGKEAGISVIKSLFSALPYAGGMLNEIVFDYRSRVKQNRLNSFTSLLAEFFTENPNIDPGSLKTEEFSDIFESVIRRVVLTKSKEKHERYRDVLIRHIYEPHKEIDSAETYLDLISSLDEMAIRILAEHAKFSSDFAIMEGQVGEVDSKARKTEQSITALSAKFPVDENALGELKAQLTDKQSAANVIRQQIIDRQEFRKSEYFDITPSEFMYYKQTLYSKALLLDKGFGTHGGSQPFNRMWATDFGENFIKFLSTG
jgi:hypothetical protein